MKFNTVASTAALIFIVTARVIEKPPSHEPNHLNPTTAFWDDDYASETEWKTYTAKGGALLCGLHGTDQTAGLLLQDTRSPPSAASRFTSDFHTTLQTWHWRSVHPSSFSCSFSTHWAMSNALRALGLSGTPTAQGGDNECFRVEHWDPEMRDERGNQIPAVNQWYSVPGMERKYRVSGLSFS